MWLFARGFVGSRHCLLALFQLGEVHVVAIVRIQVRNSSPFCLLPSPFATLHCRFPIQLGTHAKRTKVRTVSFLPGRDSSIPIMFPIPPVPCPLHRVRHCLQGPLYFQTRLQRTLLGFPFETHTLSLKQFSPACPSPAFAALPFLCFLSIARFDECAPRRVHGTKIDTKVRDIIVGVVKGALNLGLSGRVRCFNTKLSFLTTKRCYT